MINVNKILLSGRLTKDAEVKYTSAGRGYIQFSIAHNSYKKVGTEFVQEAMFLTCFYWPSTKVGMPEAVVTTLLKGTSVFVDGTLKSSEYVNQSGTKAVSFSISAFKVQIDRTSATGVSVPAPVAVPAYQSAFGIPIATPPGVPAAPAAPVAPVAPATPASVAPVVPAKVQPIVAPNFGSLPSEDDGDGVEVPF